MSEQNKFDSTYSAVLSIANNLIEQGKYDSTYSAVLSIYQNLTGDTTTSFDSVYSIVVNIAEGIESGEIDLGGGSDIELVSLNETVTYNGLHQFVPVDGIAYNQVDITVDIPNETLTQTITTNGTYDYTPSEGFFNGVSVTVDVPTGGGGSGSEEQDFSPKIRFFDFDGNIVEQWTLDEAKTKTEDDFPTLESIGFDSFDLNFDGWNTPLQDMHETTSDIAVGSMWRPSDGNSWIKVNIGPENLTTVLFIEVLGDCVVDWGDGTTDDADTISGYPQHTYDSAGEKWIKIIGDWNPMWGSTENMTEKYNNYPIWYYNNQITEIYLGRDTERYSFSYLKSLQYITFPNVQHTYTNTIQYFSFAQDSSLKNLYLPYGDGDMPTSSETSGSFYQCYNLEVFSWRGWSQSGEIGGYQFYKLYNLRYTTIYHKVNRILTYAFYNCSSLQSINIPNSVRIILTYAFYNCSSLQSINIPNSVTEIYNDAFSFCSSLQSINIPNSVTYMRSSWGTGCFYSCYALQSINIPDRLTVIEGGMFKRCYSLQSINIPNSITTIDSEVFKDIKYITVDFSQHTQVPTLSSTSSFDSTATILVPSALYDEWISATNWSSLASRIYPV